MGLSYSYFTLGGGSTDMSQDLSKVPGVKHINTVHKVPKDSFLWVYWQQCGYCHRAVPTMQALSAQFKVFSIDGIANRAELSFLPIQGYPTIFFKDKHDMFYKYPGPMELQSLQAFAQRYS